MDCTTQGVIAEVFPVRSGQRQNGQMWKNQEFLLEIPGPFVSKVKFVIKDEKVDAWGLQVGEVVTLKFFVRSNQVGDKWFTDAEAFALQRANPRPQTVAPPPPPKPPVDELRWE